MKVTGTRALAAACIDSRAVQDRLDEVLGVGGCLAVAREMDREGLAEVIDRLRAARNAVVRMAGA